jgi:hypothetical protein
MSQQPCEERQRLQRAFLEATLLLKAHLSREMYPDPGGDADCKKHRRLLAKAREEHQTAKEVLVRHIREHGCHGM